MGEILEMESYIQEKRKKEMVKLFSSIENYLIQFNQLADSLGAIILRGEGDGIGSEMFDKMSSKDRVNLRVMFEMIEFKIRNMKDHTMMPEN